MRHLAEAAGVAGDGSISMTSNASPRRSEVWNRSAGTIGSPLNRSPSAQTLLGGAALDDLQLLRESRDRGAVPPSRRGTDGCAAPGQHASSTAAASAKPPEKHCPITDTLAAGLLVEVAGQRPQVVRDRAILVGRERRELLGHAPSNTGTIAGERRPPGVPYSDGWRR
jgi:hypothetical protein